MDDDEVPEIGGEKRSINWVYNQLRDCRDIQPDDACEDLGIPCGATFADGVRFKQYEEDKMLDQQDEEAGLKPE